jgi:hypothetical protein
MRQKHGFALTAWVLLPDRWHALIYPAYPLTLSTVFPAVKVSSTVAVNVPRRERGTRSADLLACGSPASAMPTEP